MDNTIWIVVALGVVAWPLLSVVMALGLCRAAKTAEQEIPAGSA